MRAARRSDRPIHLRDSLALALTNLPTLRDDTCRHLLTITMDPKPTESVISTAGIREDVLKQKLSLFFGPNAKFEVKSTKDGVRPTLG